MGRGREEETPDSVKPVDSDAISVFGWWRENSEEKRCDQRGVNRIALTAEWEESVGAQGVDFCRDTGTESCIYLFPTFALHLHSCSSLLLKHPSDVLGACPQTGKNSNTQGSSMCVF